MYVGGTDRVREVSVQMNITDVENKVNKQRISEPKYPNRYAVYNSLEIERRMEMHGYLACGSDTHTAKSSR